MSKRKTASLSASFGGTRYSFRFLLVGALLLIWSCTHTAAASGEPRTDAAGLVPEADLRAYSLDPEPLVTLSFDDASQTVYDTAFPILDSHGIPATFYFMTSFLSDQWKLQLKDLENHGWEIGSHSRTHPVLTSVSEPDLIEEVSQSKADLESAGLTITGFAYPYGIGGDDPAVLRQVKRYYSYARSVDPGGNDPIISQYRLKTQVVVSYTSPEMMKSWVDSAVENRQWVVILMHTVDDTGNEYAISPANLSELAGYIKTKVDAGALKAVTVQEGVTRYSQTDWHPIDDPQFSPQSDIVIANGRMLWYLGRKVSDYLYDGYEWVESGELRYYEWGGQYRVIFMPSQIALQTISADRITAEFSLSSMDGAASVVSTVNLVPGGSLAEIRTTAVEGSPTALSLAKVLTRRFSIDEGLLVTDGNFETGMRTYGHSAKSYFAFDRTTGLIRIMAHSQPKSHSEYSDYGWGEFRSNPISVATELPYTWFVGGIVFDTINLLAEAETGTLEGEAVFYTGADASPRSGDTGVILTNNDAMTVHVTPPAQGDYTLAIRHKGVSAGDQFSYQIDGGEVVTRAVRGTSFGYENIALHDLSAQGHDVRLSAVNGTIDVDYVLLVPISRSANTPPGVEFPADVAGQTYHRIFLPLAWHQDN